ncbi:MAG: hypothetical protein GX265_01125 [Mollicutes bacterium]|nr:hypothetical protein [Mollicutes bacterium]
MNYNETFNVNYKNKNYQISKSDIKFTHGYGIVEINLNNPLRMNWGNKFNYEINIKGVINENYQIVLTFNDYNHIQIFPDDNLIVKINHFNELDNIEYQHYKLINKSFKKICSFYSKNYEIINDNTLKISFDDFDTLYSLTNAKYISNQFTTIGKFENQDNNPEKLALAIYQTPYGDISCYIDITGKIRTPLIISDSDIKINIPDKDFDFIETIKNIEIIMKAIFENNSKDYLSKNTKQRREIMESNKNIKDNIIEKINDNVVKLREENYEVLYDIFEDEIISDRFSHIDKFDNMEKIEMKLAKAIFEIPYKDTCYEGICYIDEFGDIMSALYIPDLNKQCPIKNNLQQTIESIQAELESKSDEAPKFNGFTR